MKLIKVRITSYYSKELRTVTYEDFNTSNVLIL